jgi:2-desacetyl-2-hydroxyethyl bacteriochlorophyllide A dehydrogenase
MDMRATAVVFEAARQVALREIELPQPGDEEIVIENVYTGISVGTEGWILRGERPQSGDFPCVPGYQQSGIVSYVGPKVSTFKVGDRVNCWSSRLPPGINSIWAAHVSRSVNSYVVAVRIPDAVSFKVASLAKLFAVGYHGVEQTELNKGDLVAVLGLGMIGQGYAQIARTRGATVVGADIAQNRIDLAHKYSCDAAVLSSELEDAVREIKPEGADVVVDTTGRSELIDECVRIARPKAKIVWQGWYPGRVSFDFHKAHEKQVKMVFPCSIEGEDVVLDMLARGELVLEPMISTVFPAKEAPKAYELMLGDPNAFLGVTLKWRDE